MTTLSCSKAHEESLGYKGNTPVALLKTGAWIDGLIRGKDKEENTDRSNNATTSVLARPEKKRTTNMGRSWSRTHEESLGHKGNTPEALLKTGAWLDGLFQDGKASGAITANSIPTRYRSERGHTTRWIQDNPATVLVEVVVSKVHRDEQLDGDDDSAQTSTTRTTNTGTIDTMASNNVPDSRDDDYTENYACDEVDPIISIGSMAHDDAPRMESMTVTTTTNTSTTTTTTTRGVEVKSFPPSLSTTSRRRFHPFQRIREWKSLVANRKNILHCPIKEEPTPEQVLRDATESYCAAPPPGIPADESRNLHNGNTHTSEDPDEKKRHDEVEENDCIDNIHSMVLEKHTYLCKLVGFLAEDLDETGLLPCGPGRRNDTTSFDELTFITDQSNTGIMSSSIGSSSSNLDESTLLCDMMVEG